MEILKTWLSAERGRGGKLARHLHVAPSFITKMANGEKPIPSDQAAQIELFTGGAVTRQHMFPDSWSRIWPELAGDSADEVVSHGCATSNEVTHG